MTANSDRSAEGQILVNRAPVLTLWAAVVAEHLGQPRATALTLGKAVAGLNAQSKGRRLGIYEPAESKRKPRAEGQPEGVPLLGRLVPVRKTPSGLRALNKEQVVDPAGVERYLRQKFGEDLARVRAAMEALAAAYRPNDLEEVAYPLYERFRPEIPGGVRGWGAKGRLSLRTIRNLARQFRG
jgi:hypothetical protein